MHFPSENIVSKLKADYPKGTRVRLIKMDDVQAPPLGTKGTVDCVDDTGTIHVIWDNGSRLGIVYGEDTCVKTYDFK